MAGGAKTNITYGKAGPGADLRIFVEKRLLLTLNNNRKVVGQLRGYDVFMNIVLDNCVELRKNEVQRPMGTTVIRGNAIQSWECLDRIEQRM
ncbi:putative small nuclear ribonucleoprotein G [Gregarina niphandrodes]|uniref:Small nuclear ribonucleoprotein G n=1 Tax=Gregarina niphandrodes TaxID=110365 RepID=A0A023AZD4_GRENI|nr:putative small nuclear ribonucleoprotein G [Gregarina niphandrodes]EZG43843.1 putative small nuclear ribonucleoprotein G [Gregarina niphandrodes]|eukprot:XP_011132964.1 putative small nuclear ribonucleoprotein G [Gregarina niphandrodes]